MSIPKEIRIKVGRRAQDGSVSLSIYPPQLLTLSVSYKAERGTSIVMTREQIRQLQQALAELELLIEAEETTGAPWNGSKERRAVVS